MQHIMHMGLYCLCLVQTVHAQLHIVLQQTESYLKLLTSQSIYSSLACGPATALISSSALKRAGACCQSYDQNISRVKLPCAIGSLYSNRQMLYESVAQRPLGRTSDSSPRSCPRARRGRYAQQRPWQNHNQHHLWLQSQQQSSLASRAYCACPMLQQSSTFLLSPCQHGRAVSSEGLWCAAYPDAYELQSQ